MTQRTGTEHFLLPAAVFSHGLLLTSCPFTLDSTYQDLGFEWRRKREKKRKVISSCCFSIAYGQLLVHSSDLSQLSCQLLPSHSKVLPADLMHALMAYAMVVLTIQTHYWLAKGEKTTTPSWFIKDNWVLSFESAPIFFKIKFFSNDPQGLKIWFHF